MPPTETRVIPTIFYANKVYNVSNPEALAALSASIYPDEAGGVAVPLVELIAHGLLVLSIAAAFLSIAFHRRTRKYAASDSWEQLPTADVAVKFFTAIAAVDLAMATSVFVIMCVPVVHDGAFATWVYAGALPLPPSPPSIPLHSPPLPSAPLHSPPLPSPSPLLAAHLLPAPVPRAYQSTASSTTSRGFAACTAPFPSLALSSPLRPFSSSLQGRASWAWSTSRLSLG